MSERSLCQARASVMVYNNEIKKWEHAGGVQGISRVHVYFNNGNNLYRIVGRKLHDNEVVINCVIMKNLKYNKATPTFHQWRDQRQVYGLNFQSPDDALSFSDAVFGAIENLNNPQPPQDSTYAIPSQQNGSVDEDPYSRYKQFTDDPYQSARTLSHSSSGGSPVKTSPQEPSRPTHVTISSTSRTPEPTGPPRPPAGPPPAPAPPAAPPAPPAAPAAPPAPPAPPAAPPPPPSGPPAPPPPPGGPPPPGAPPPPGGGPPPPPPPPPPPSAGAPAGPPKAGGGGLAEALANAKLKKASQPAEQKSSGGGGGGIDLMGEMQKKLLARKKRADSGNDDGGSSVSPVPAKSIVNTPTPASPKVQPTKKFSSSEPPAPQNKSKTIGGFNKLNRGNSEEAGISSEQLKTLKQEILDAVKSEIDAAKEEIIKTLRQELSKLASN